MEIDVVFTGMPVTDFAAALQWYTRFFDRPADVVAHDHEVMWRATDTGWVYIVADDAHAGNGLLALAVSDLDVTTSALRERGITPGPTAPEGDAGRKAVVHDPDGNTIALIEVTHPS